MFSYGFCSYMIFIFMISQVIFWSGTTKILISYCFLQHFWVPGTCGKTVFFRLFHFDSWAIFKNHLFSLGFPMFFREYMIFIFMISQVIFWSRTTESWFHIVFYSIFEPWAPLEKTGCFRLFHFLSWAIFKNHWFSLGFPMFFAHTWSSFSWFLKNRNNKSLKKKRCP